MVGWFLLALPRIIYLALADISDSENSLPLKQNRSGHVCSVLLLLLVLTQWLKYWQKVFVVLPVFLVHEVCCELILA